MNTTIKAIALAAVIALVAVTLVSEDSSAVEFTDGGFEYRTSGNNATVIGWEGDSSEITIPDTVTNGSTTYNVTAIGDEAFMGSDVTGVDFSNATHLTSIGDRAFFGLDIAEVVLTASLTSLGDDAFSGNDAVETVEIPARLSTYSHSFANCSSLESITVASGNNHFSSSSGVLLSEGGETVYQYPAGKSGNFQDPDVTTIREKAFQGSSITTFTITEAITSIGDGAFADCDALTSFVMASEKTNRTFTVKDGVLFTDSNKTLQQYPAGKTDASYTIPTGTTEISPFAFMGSKVSTVTFPTSLRTIGAEAFSGSSITSLTLNSGLTNVGQGAFSDCDTLTQVSIPSSVRSLGNYVFAGCTALETVGWAAATSGNNSIGAYTFSGCTSLSSMEIPQRTTTIGMHAFEGCTSLVSVTFPDTVDIIGDYAFAYSGLGAVILPEGVNDLGDYAFAGCPSLTEATLPSTLDTIPVGAFSGCTSLSKVNFAEEGLETVGVGAFQSTRLTSVSFPEGVTSIGDSALANCPSLSSVALPSTLRTLGDHVMDSCPALTAIAVAEGSTAFSSVDGVLFGNGGNVLLKYPTASTATSYEVPEGVTSISAAAFDHSLNLTMVDIPASVTAIGEGAFAGCSGIREILIASTELTVADGAFDLSDGGEPVSVEIFTDLEPFAESAFGDGVTVTYDEYKNYGIRSTDELLGDALIWVVVAIVLGIIFLAISIRKIKA